MTAAAPPETPLTDLQIDILWEIAQHKYGWTYLRGRGWSAAGLIEQGLIEVNGHNLEVTPTSAGDELISERWQVSPYILGTYAPQDGGWTPRRPDARVS